MIHDARDSFGGYLEDFQVGDVFRHWPGKTVTEADNHLFSLLTMNTNPLHTDENYMKDHQHGKILVVGPLVISLLVGMSVARHVGQGRRQPGVREDHPRRAGLPGRHDIWRERDTRRAGVAEPSRQGHRVHGEPRLHQHGEKVVTLRRRFLVAKRGD